MRKVLAVCIVAVLLVSLDVAARSIAEQRIEQRARSEATGAAVVDARVGSFPFVPRLLAGSVPTVELHLEQVPSRALTLTAVDVDLRGVEVDPGSVLSRPVVRDLEQGTVSVELDGASLSRALRVPVSVRSGEVRVDVRGRSVPVRAEGGQGSLVLRARGLPPFSVPVARTRPWGCGAADVTVRDDRVRLACRVDGVPPVLRG